MPDFTSSGGGGSTPSGSPGVGQFFGLGNQFGIPQGMSLREYLGLKQSFTAQHRSNNNGANPTPQDFNDFLNFTSSQKNGGTPGVTSSGNPAPPWWTNLIPKVQLGGGNTTVNNPAQNNGGGGQRGIPPWLMAILATAAGGAENRSQTTNTTSTSTPNLGEKENTFKDSLIGKWTDFLGKDPDLSGYGATQIGANNKEYDALKQQREGQLASRGITGPASSFAIDSLDNERFGKNVDLKNSLPLLSNQLKSDALSKAGSFFGQLPHGTINTSETKTSGNLLGGGLQGLLAYLLGLQE